MCAVDRVAAENAETATVTAEAERLQDVTAEEEQPQAALIRAKSSRGGMAELTELEEAIDAAVEAGLTGDSVSQAARARGGDEAEEGGVARRHLCATRARR